MQETVHKIAILLALACTALLLGKRIFQSLRNRWGKEKTARAKVVDKFKLDQFSRNYGPAAARPHCYIVFQLDGGRKSFRVSEFSYGSYKVNTWGILKYKGNRLIDFS